MEPIKDLSTGRYEGIKSTISDISVRRIGRRTDPRKVIEMASKVSRNIQASNQTINNYYLNGSGATIHSKGQKLN